MKISVITPVHTAGAPFLSEAYDSLLDQKIGEWWEWVLVPNGDPTIEPRILLDPRVRCVEGGRPGSVGALKRLGFEAADGDVLVELDCDDLLTPDALTLIAAAVERGAGFVYSNFAEFHHGSWAASTFGPIGAACGWRTRPVGYHDHLLRQMIAPPATAQNIRLVDWAPNHVRAWTVDAYRAAGGHDPALPVADDHDLVVRTYLAGVTMVHIDECLYLYRLHAENTVRQRNAEVRDGAWGVYNRHLWTLAETWADRAGLLKIDLCGAIDTRPGYTVLDAEAPGRPDTPWIRADATRKWPLATSSVGVLRANDAVEHLPDAVHTMNEAYRVLAPGGFLLIHVPSSNGAGAFCDPTHVSFWNKLSFRYYTDPAFARYLPSFTGRFAVSRVIEWFPSAWHKEENVPYVEAHLIALKPGYDHMGETLWGRSPRP